MRRTFVMSFSHQVMINGPLYHPKYANRYFKLNFHSRHSDASIEKRKKIFGNTKSILPNFFSVLCIELFLKL